VSWRNPKAIAVGLALLVVGAGLALAINRWLARSTRQSINHAPVAMDDTGTTHKDSVLSVSAPGVLANDTDRDTADRRMVADVNGVTVHVGNQITLASGALLTLNTDGSYHYDPNGQFDLLEADESDNDRFSYTLADSQGGTDTATVTITIRGSDERQQRLWLALSWAPPSPSGKPETKPDLWLFDAPGEWRRRVTDSAEFVDLQPQFSPDGRRILFLRATSPMGSSVVCVCDTDGSNLRELAIPKDDMERVLSPVWVDNSRIYYTLHTRHDRRAEAEIWQIDLEGREPRLVFRFKEALGRRTGVVTDVSPDGEYLAVIAQNDLPPSTADVYITDHKGRRLHTIWEDADNDYADARAVWSPDGQRIAWLHSFVPGDLPRGTEETITFGIGMASKVDGNWTSRLQDPPDTCIAPVAWAQDSRVLLCARLHDGRETFGVASLFLMDCDFQPFRYLFELRAHWQQWGPRWSLCRLGDWALLPEDAPLPAKGSFRRSPSRPGRSPKIRD
jgi:VCBS repeat-containing protein